MQVLKRPFILYCVALSLCMPMSASNASIMTEKLGILTSKLYTYSLTIAGLSVFVMFVIAGLATMIPGLKRSVGEPTAIIKDAIIGLIILVSAYVILNSINPDLVRSTTP